MIRKLLLFLMITLSSAAFAQDYEIWGTIKLSGNLTDRLEIEVEGEDRYNFDAGNIRYFHYDIGFLYSINKSFKAGFFYRDIFETKDNVISRVTVPHGDVIFSNSGFKFRTRLEYIVKYQDYENKFRLRLRPEYQTKFWNNFNPFIKDEIFLTDIDYLVRNRLNAGITIKMGKFKIQPGYLLESNHKDLWKNRNILWVNMKIQI